MPPVAMMIASAGKVRTSIDRRSIAQMPRQTRFPSSTADRNSQCSYFFTLPSDSYLRTCSSSAYSSCCPVVAPANAVRLYNVPPKRRKSSNPSGVRLKGTPMRSSRSMIPGAASHMSLIGGWLPRKSPPYTVSSKCFQVESPSPFRFLAALIPPCAQTECDRFTGTIENRSTSPPISAILMTAASPASPPPTTMILGAAMLLHPRCGGGVARVDNVSVDSGQILEPRVEGVQAGQAYD